MAVVANFTYCISSGSPSNPPYTVIFTDTSPGSPDTWFWDFGDGSSSTSPNPIHTYETAGPHTVTLTVWVFESSSLIYPFTTSREQKTSWGSGSRDAAYANWLAASWGGGRPSLFWRYRYLPSPWFHVFDGCRNVHNWNLISSSGTFAAIITPSVFGGNESGLRVNLFNQSIYPGTKPPSTPFIDVTDRLGTSFSSLVEDANDFAKLLLGAPPDAGWYTCGGPFQTSESINCVLPIIVHTTTDIDSISKPIVVLKAVFTATPLSGANPVMVNFEDKSQGSPVYWSWRKRKGGTSDAWVEFSTEQNPSHLLDKDNP